VEKPPPKFASKLLLALASVLFFLCLLEAASRLYFNRALERHPEYLRELLVEPDSRCIYRLRPGVSVKDARVLKFDRYFRPTVELRVDVSVNSKGFRDEEFSRKPPGVKRVFCLGDSITYAEEVAARDAYPKVLERLLGGKAEVINAGVFGYSTLQILGRLEEVLGYEPDVVVIQFPVNNAGREAVPDRELVGRSVGLSRLLHKSRLFFLLSRFFGRTGRRGDVIRVQPEESRAHLEAMAKLCRERGVKVIFLFPAHQPWQPEYDFPVLRPQYLRGLRQVAARYNIEVLDMQRKLEELGLDALLVDDCHLTKEGHRQVAEALLPAVREALGGD